MFFGLLLLILFLSFAVSAWCVLYFAHRLFASLPEIDLFGTIILAVIMALIATIGIFIGVIGLLCTLFLSTGLLVKLYDYKFSDGLLLTVVALFIPGLLSQLSTL